MVIIRTSPARRNPQLESFDAGYRAATGDTILGTHIKASTALLLVALSSSCADLPTYTPVESIVYPDQNWTEAQRRWFYHTSQGTKLMPYRWFLALEQPELSLSGAPHFAAADYLARFGFLPDPVSTDNPDGLPVGFARDDFGEREGTAERETVVGLTCAACHTGQIEYQKQGIRVDGGPAMTNTALFQYQIGIALLLTSESEPRFSRFADYVLGTPDMPNTPTARDELRARLNTAIAAGKAEKGQADQNHLYPVDEGFGRLDALGRGGNFVFGTLLQDPRNLNVADGPVSYPALWDAPWFDWVQYNGAIRQPMGRNVAEAMGVRSLSKLSGTPENLYKSSVRIENIYEMERSVAGPTPGSGLRSPAWPEGLLGKIDHAAAERGRTQYQQLCSGCHEGKWTTAPGTKRPYLQLSMIPLAEIGTDAKAAMNFMERTAYLKLSDTKPVSAAAGLQTVTNEVIQRWYDDNHISTAIRHQMDGYSPNVWRAPAAYRARPLNGIWTTAPYLHNGSIPNLYQLLSPAKQRDTTFFTGSRQFDPKNVGFVTTRFDGASRFDTLIPGNSNRGHEFSNAPKGAGVIGPELTEDQRHDLIEYLKTL